jgi:hypothetical protein
VVREGKGREGGRVRVREGESGRKLFGVLKADVQERRVVEVVVTNAVSGGSFSPSTIVRNQ